MGLFSNKKCPIHRVEYKIDKDYMCQQYYFCPECRKEKEQLKKIQDEIAKLRNIIRDQQESSRNDKH